MSNETFYNDIESRLTTSRREFLERREKIIEFLSEIALNDWKNRIDEAVKNDKKSLILYSFTPSQTFIYDEREYLMPKFYHSLFDRVQEKVHPFLLKKKYDETLYSIIMLLPFKKN